MIYLFSNVFKNEKQAAQNGWTIKGPFVSANGRYKVMAEHEMGRLRKFFQSVFVNVLSLITWGYALNNKTIAHWQQEVEKGKIITEIYCQTISKIENSSNSSVNPPEIVTDDWATITVKVDGNEKIFQNPKKDALILPTSVEYWDWAWDKKDSMHHQPGVRIKDLDHFIFSKDLKLDAIILSTGRGHGDKRNNLGPGILKIEPTVEEYIKKQGVSEVYILKTAAAVDKYKEIYKQKRVAILVHTTC